MTTTNDWIRMSERIATDNDMPVWAESPGWDEPEKPRLFWNIRDLFDPGCHPARSWKPAKADIPAPPKEQTQRKRDIDAFEKFCEHTAAAQHSGACSPSWHAALAWERAEIAKLLDGVPVEDSYNEGYSKLRARLRL